MPKAGRRGGYRELARELGVSPTTVSLVLSGRAGQYRIAAETERRILARAAEAGAASPRNRRRRRTLLVGLPEEIRSVDRPGFVSEILDPLTAGLVAQGWRITLARFTSDAPLGVTPALLREATAVVLPATGATERLVRQLALDALKAGVVPVVLGRSYPGLRALMVDGDQEGGGRSVAVHLHELGHRDVAVVVGHRRDRHSIERLRGFTAEWTRRGRRLPPGRVWGNGEYWIVRSHDLTLERFRADPPPTAVFYMCDMMAIGGIYALREQGRRVPQDVSIVGYDDSREATRGMAPALTTVRIDVGDAGRRLAAKLSEAAAGGGAATLEAMTFRCPARLIVRESTAAPRGK